MQIMSENHELWQEFLSELALAKQSHIERPEAEDEIRMAVVAAIILNRMGFDIESITESLLYFSKCYINCN